MRALVVYESMYGNTKLVAEWVAAGLQKHLPATLVEVGGAPRNIPADVALLVVGGPTHAFSLSRERTRADAARRAHGPLVSTGSGLREWINELHATKGRRLPAAAFATRVRRPRLPGSAAAAAARRLGRAGFDVVVSPKDFWVEGGEGPLCDGAEQAARSWGAGLGAKVTEPLAGVQARA